jgi:hypothetical protein
MDQRTPTHSDATLLRQVEALSAQVRHQSQQISRLETMLQELIAISLLPESERAAISVEHRKRRLANLKQQIDHVLTAERYDQLEPLIIELQTHFKNDPDAETLRLNAWARRDAAMAEAISRVRERAQALMSVNKWPEAHLAIREELKRFPDQPELLSLLRQVDAEHHAWREQAVNTLYTQVRDSIGRRDWRRALRDAEEMAGRFSDHPRGVKIIQQLETIRENAEIEHRQEMERELQQLVKSRRFDEAMTLAEDLIRHYPLSPQAAECRALIPKLEERAMQEEADRLSSH